MMSCHQRQTFKNNYRFAEDLKAFRLTNSKDSWYYGSVGRAVGASSCKFAKQREANLTRCLSYLPYGVNPFRGSPLSAAFGAFRRRKAEGVEKVKVKQEYNAPNIGLPL